MLTIQLLLNYTTVPLPINPQQNLKKRKNYRKRKDQRWINDQIRKKINQLIGQDIFLDFAQFLSAYITYPQHIQLYTSKLIIKHIPQQLSKPELRKIQKSFELIESIQNQGQIKQRQKKKPASKCSINPNKQALRDDQNAQTHQTKSTQHLTPLSQKTRQAQERQTVRGGGIGEGGLNESYPLQGLDVGSYLIVYNHRQGLKDLEKGQEIKSILQEGDPIQLHHSSNSIALCQKLRTVISGCLKSDRKMFSKAHRQCSKLLRRFKPSQLKN